MERLGQMVPKSYCNKIIRDLNNCLKRTKEIKCNIRTTHFQIPKFIAGITVSVKMIFFKLRYRRSDITPAFKH